MPKFISTVLIADWYNLLFIISILFYSCAMTETAYTYAESK